MCTSPITIRVPPNSYEEHVLGIHSMKEVTVPCGKCTECLSKRQNDIAVRGFREAVDKGNCWFLTLTYRPSHVPFACSMLDINKDTGESIIHSLPEISTASYLDDIKYEYRSSRGMFYKYVPFAEFDSDDGCRHLYQYCFTPTLYYRDVALLIKNFRVRHKRLYKYNPDFTYIAVGEYGSHGSHRPHYHLLLFGLLSYQVDMLCSMWDKGFWYLKKVKAKNEDGSDGFAKVCKYVSKYAAKGKFNPESVLSHLTLSSRICSSRGLGLKDLENIFYYHRCYDLFGRYDPNKLDIPVEKKSLLFTEVLKRLKLFNFDGRKICVPQSICRKIFGYKVIDGKASWNLLYYEVMAFARDNYKEIRDREFFAFLDSFPDRSLSEKVDAFNVLQESSLRARKDNGEKLVRQYYSRSKFS